jgi:tectonin-like protein
VFKNKTKNLSPYLTLGNITMFDFKRIGVYQLLIIWSVLTINISTVNATESISLKKIITPSKGTVDISVGSSGATWVAGRDGAAYLWKDKKWVSYGGKNFVRIAVDPEGNAWAIDKKNVIFYSTDNNFKEFHTGRALDIGIGADGSKWVVGTDGAAWRWDGNNWIKVGGSNLTRIAVDNEGNPWAISNNYDIYQYVNKNFKKNQTSRAKDVGFGADGSIWILGYDDAPWKWDGKNWQKHAGGFTSISVDPQGIPWAVNIYDSYAVFADDRAQSYKNEPQLTTATPTKPAQKPVTGQSLSWVQAPSSAVDVSVGADGFVWIMGTDGFAHRWDGKAWIKVGNRDANESITDPKKGIWVVANNNQIWRFDGNVWKQMPGAAKDIGIGANGVVWIVGTDGAAYKWNSKSKSWSKMGGALIERIAVNPKGIPWIINKRQEIWQYTGSTFKQLQTGRATDIGIGAEGSVWIVGTDNAPYRWDGKNWQKHAGGITRITVDSKGHPWGVNASKKIYADSRSPSYKTAPQVVAAPVKPSRKPELAPATDKASSTVTTIQNLNLKKITTPKIGAADISVGADGATWIAGWDGRAYLWKNKKWVSYGDGEIAKIATDPNDGFWAVRHASRAVWRNDAKGFKKLNFFGKTNPAEDIDVGANGAVWVVGKNGKAYQLKTPIRNGNDTWSDRGGRNLVHIAVDKEGNAWAIDKQYNIFQYINNSFRRHQQSQGKDISIGADGSIWKLGMDDAPWVWEDNKWRKYGGGFTSISVDPQGYPWAINYYDSKAVFADSRARSYSNAPKIAASVLPEKQAGPVNKTIKFLDASSNDLPWFNITGRAIEVSVGANGATWVLGERGNAYRWDAKSKKWIDKGGRNLIRIAVDNKGLAWAIDKKYVIFHYKENAFKQFPTGRAIDIAVGINGDVWVVGTDGYAYELIKNKWIKAAGSDNYKRIAVDNKGKPWTISKKNQIFKYANNSLRPFHAGPALDISIGTDGSIWIVGSNNAPYRWDDKQGLWKKYKSKGLVKNISVEPSGLPWVINGKNEIYAHRDSNSYKNSPTPASKPVSEKTSEMLSSAETLIKELNIPHMNKNWNNWKNTYEVKKDNNVGGGELLTLKVNILNKPVTIVIYKPKSKTKLTDNVNVAVIAEDLKISDLIKATDDTFLDDTEVKDITYIFVSAKNAENIDTSELPKLVKEQVEKVRTGPISIVSGQNMFGTANAYGTTDDVLQTIGLPLENLKVSVAYGQKRSENTGNDYKTDPYKAVRLKREGVWNKPFKIKNTQMTNPTFEYIKLGNIKTIRGWGKGKVKETEYDLLFLQKQGPGAWPTAAAFDAESVTLKDYINVLTVFGESLFGSEQHVKKMLDGIDKLPLDEFVIENPNYREGNAIDEHNNPVFNNLLIMGAAKGNELPDAEKTQGPIVRVHGKAKVFGHTAGTANGWFRDQKGMDFETTIDLPDVGGASLGSAKLDVYREGNKYSMAFTGNANVTVNDTEIIDEDIKMMFSNNRFKYSLGESCAKPIGFDLSLSKDFKDNKFEPTFVDTFGCLEDIWGGVIDGAEAVAAVAEETGAAISYSVDMVNNLSQNVAGSISDLVNGAYTSVSSAACDYIGIGDCDDDDDDEPPKLNCNFPEVAWQGRCQNDFALSNHGTSAYQSSRADKRYNSGMLINESRGNNFTQTQNEANPWMSVDLFRSRWIDNVVLFGRQDTNYLDGAIVAMSNYYSGKELMTKQHPEIYRTQISNAQAAMTIRPGKWGQGKKVKNIIVYYAPTKERPTSTLALTEIMAFSNDCHCENFWRQVPGGGRDIATGGGKIWIVSNSDVYQSNAPLKDMPTAKSPWKKMSKVPDPNGIIKRITVDEKGNPWVLLEGGQIYHYWRGAKGFQWYRVQGSARDIAAAQNVIVMASISDDDQIYRRSITEPDGSDWGRMDGVTGRQVAGSYYGMIWIVDRNGKMYSNPGIHNGNNRFSQIPGNTKAIAINGNYDGLRDAFHFSTEDKLYRFVNKKWQRMPGEGKRITVDSYGTPWMLGDNGSIWMWTEGNQ